MPKSRDKIFTIIMFSGFFAAGLVTLILSTAYTINLNAKTGGYVKTTGKVVSFKIEKKEKIENGRYRDVIYNIPIVEYEADGKKHRISTGLSGELEPAIGRKVSLKYNAQNPQDAVISSVLDSKSWFLIFFGFMVSVISALALSMEMDIEGRKMDRIRILLFYMTFAGSGAVAYAYIGNSAGTFNPVKMLKYTIWAGIPILFIIVILFCIIMSVIYKEKNSVKLVK